MGINKTPYRIAIILGFLAFVCLTLLAYRAVTVADKGQEAARNEAAQARIEAAESNRRLNEVQAQLNCVNKNVLRAVVGGLKNSINQDDLLLASSSGASRDAIQTSLINSKNELVEILRQATAAQEKECQ